MRFREYLLIALIALIGAFVIVRLVVRPTYTDSFYHFNAANQGLTDAYIWTYIGQQIPVLPTPSHLYWMPLTSMLAGSSMRLFNAPGDFATAQLPFVLLFAGTICIGYALGYKLGGSRRHAIIAAALTLCSGFYTKFWGEMDTFAPYAFSGSLCLLALGYGLEKRHLGWFALAGLMAGFGHLTRSDGLLLIMVGLLVIPIASSGKRTMQALCLLAGYFAVMSLWFMHMIQVTGSPLPVGGLQAMWFTEYNDLFRYPPDASAGEFFANGLDLLFQTRWTALIQNLQTFLFVEGWIVLMPLALIGLWRKRGRFILPMMIFTLGIHAAMTFVFPFPGWRGGLLHGTANLIPWWAALIVIGLDAIVDWIAARRRKWQPQAAKTVFSAGLILLALVLTFTNARGVTRSTATPQFYENLRAVVPPDARLLINDPAQLFYYTGMGGAVLPNESPNVLDDIAQRYGITHLVLEGISTTADGRTISYAVPAPLQAIFDEIPPFLDELPSGMPGVRIYQFR